MEKISPAARQPEAERAVAIGGAISAFFGAIIIAATRADRVVDGAKQYLSLVWKTGSGAAGNRCLEAEGQSQLAYGEATSIELHCAALEAESSEDLHPSAPHAVFRSAAEALEQALGARLVLKDLLLAALALEHAHMRENAAERAICVLLTSEIVFARHKAFPMLTVVQRNLAEAFDRLGDRRSAEMYALSALELSVQTGATHVELPAFAAEGRKGHLVQKLP